MPHDGSGCAGCSNAAALKTSSVCCSWPATAALKTLSAFYSWPATAGCKPCEPATANNQRPHRLANTSLWLLSPSQSRSIRKE
eukprot:208932-Chlamydomonas_euryale.AAC.3